MFILSIPIWEPLKGWVDSKFSYLRSWLQTNLGGSWRCCERGMPFVYWKWLFLQNCCSMSCILPSFHKLCVVCSLAILDSAQSCTLFQPWSTMIHQAKDRSHWKNVPPWTRDTKKGTPPCNNFLLGHHFVFDQKSCFLGPKCFSQSHIHPRRTCRQSEHNQAPTRQGAPPNSSSKKGCVGL